jgi:uracil DNA glycosylase
MPQPSKQKLKKYSEMNTEIKDALMKQAHSLWHPLMEEWFKSDWWSPIWRTIKADIRQLSPIPPKIFRVLSMNPKNIKVVILGQD